jgi:hypothetical protein
MAALGQLRTSLFSDGHIPMHYGKAYKDRSKWTVKVMGSEGNCSPYLTTLIVVTAAHLAETDARG